MDLFVASLLLAMQPSQDIAAPINIGLELVIAQADEDRVVNIVRPESFDDDPERVYPIVILLDGGKNQWLLDAASAFTRSARRGHSQEVILVGIDTTGRRRHDLTPPMRQSLADDREHEGGGGAEEFRAWLAKEVIPLVETEFRGDGRVFLVGHSLGGLFALESLADRQMSLSGVAAISPALWWDEDAPLQRALVTLPKNADLPPLFLAVANEDPDLMRAVAKLNAALSSHDSLCFEDRPEQKHGTIVPSVLLQIGLCLWPNTDQQQGDE